MLVDATRPFGYGRILPGGLLRERISSLRRAAQQPDLTPATFQLAFGLKPPIEQAGVQFELW